MSMIRLKNVSKFYYSKGIIASGISKVNLDLDAGEFVVITGESGSGKSTLLNVISGLDTYEEGEMYIEGSETSHYTAEDFERYRQKYISCIFQSFNLVSSYTVFQNVALAMEIDGHDGHEIKQKVNEILNKVGLSAYKNRKVSKLSGGQKQRVAIARALAKDTKILVADEPTGNLDSASAEGIVELLTEIASDKLVVGLIAGGEQAFLKAIEGAEDSHTLCQQELEKINLSDKDTVVGLAASGRTPYVIYGLKFANSIGAHTIAISCNKGSEISKEAKVAIEPVVGPEVLTGSTRLKSGTAQKMILNMISTGSMIGIGKVYKNLMVDVQQ